MYAILSHGGRQYRVSAGDRLVVDRLDAEVGSVVALEPVLLTGGDGTTALGKDLDGLRVAVTVVAHRRGEKLRIFKYKAKKRSRKMAGYRSDLTELRVESILAKGAALPSAATAASLARAPRRRGPSGAPTASATAPRRGGSHGAATKRPPPRPRRRRRRDRPSRRTTPTATAKRSGQPRRGRRAPRTPATHHRQGRHQARAQGALPADQERGDRRWRIRRAAAAPATVATAPGAASASSGRTARWCSPGPSWCASAAPRSSPARTSASVATTRLYARATGLVAFDNTGKDRTRANVRSLPIIEVGELVELDEVVEAPSSAG